MLFRFVFVVENFGKKMSPETIYMLFLGFFFILRYNSYGHNFRATISAVILADEIANGIPPPGCTLPPTKNRFFI